MSKLRKFQVIADTCAGKGNKIFNGGEIVSETDFIPGRADVLVKRRFLKEINPDVKLEVSPEMQNVLEDSLSHEKKTQHVDLRPDADLEKVKKKEEIIDKHDLHPDDPDHDGDEKKQAETRTGSTEVNTNLSEVNKETSDGDVSIEQMVKDLTDAEVEFDSNASKEEIHKLWLLI